MTSTVANHRTTDTPFRTFHLPPDDFDPRIASDRELLLYGLPQRPDPGTHPRLSALWERAAARRPRFVTPTFAPMQRERSQFRDHRRLIEDERFISLLDRTDGTFGPPLRDFADLFKSRYNPWHFPWNWLIADTSTNWSGAYVNRPAAEPLKIVTGQWTVPSVSVPAAAKTATGYADGTYVAGVWVGLDGDKGSNDVLQAGTNSVVVVSGGKVASTTYYAWTEWYGFPWSVQSLGVSPGDTILLTVCAPFVNTHGVALFHNLTTNEAVNYGIDPPSGTSLSGNVAEWIVEDPSQSATALFPFANYGQTTFAQCTAGSKSTELDLNAATRIDLVDASNNVRSEATIESNSVLRCEFLR